ncbi:MAG: nicotinate-nucleotide adenylyltransferase [Candidatus Dadabacteria bacterium]
MNVLPATDEAVKDRIGLFGGTFDPVHFGHLRAAEEIRETLDLSRVWFVPSAIPPHKDKDITPSVHRLKMLEIAVEPNPFFGINTYEIEKKTTSYTIETLRHLTSTHPDAEFFFIVGSELFSRIETWKAYNELFTLSNFAVIGRPGQDDGFPSLPLALKKDFSYHNSEGNVISYINSHSKIIAFTRFQGLEISSTEIRTYVNEGASVRYLVPDGVAGYISAHKLYDTEAAL